MSTKHLLSLTGAALLLSACSLLPQQQDEAQQEEKPEFSIPAPLHIGAVHQVYPEQHFALLRMLGPVPAPGTTLISHPADGSNERVGNLCVSNATGSRHNIIAADIRSGTVVSGDRVFLYRSISEPEAREQDSEVETDNSEDDTITSDVVPPASALTEETPAATVEPASVETTVLPEDTVPAPAASADNAPDVIPDSIRDVPDTIDDWNN